MNGQSCFMLTFMSINIALLFRPANPQNAKIIISIKLCKKREIIFVYLPNTSHFTHFQSVRQKKGNIHTKTNKYRWYFWSKPHQTTSLKHTKTTKKTSKTRQNFDFGVEPKIIKWLSKCFKKISMHSVCCCSLPVWRKSSLEKGPLIDLLWSCPGSTPGRIWFKSQ